MKDDSKLSLIGKPALILLIITVIAGGLLGYVSAITEEPIAKITAQKKEESMKAVFPDAKEFGEEKEINDEVVETPGCDIVTVTPALDDKGEDMGYAVSVSTKGFSAGLELMFGIDTKGKITGLSVVNCSNETPGLGANSGNTSYTVNGEPWYEQFEGKDEQSATLTKDDAKNGEIEAITGATITSRAVSNASKESIKYIAEKYTKGGDKK